MAGHLHPKLQRLMREEHIFLYRLYREKKGRNNRRILEKASKKQVWVVLRILFCISAGHIPITRGNYAKLVQSKRRSLLRSLKNRMRTLRKSSVLQQRKFVLQFASLFHYLFEDIFVPV